VSFHADLPPFLRPNLIASWREIATVLLVLLAPFVAMSALGASHGSQTRYFQAFLSNRALLLNGAAEASILGLGLIYLHWRGWLPADLRIRPGLWSTLQAFALAPLTLVANTLVVLTSFTLLFLCQTRYPTFLQYILANSPQVTHLHAGNLSWIVLIAAMILNAFLEEIICTAYAFNQFAAKRGPALALGLTVLLRAACHTYQGPVHAAGIGAVFLIFTLWYIRTHNLWTLIFAHALIDLTSLGALKLLSH
jgi:membrane protease YdiL (CAAX protease family)